MEHAAKCQGRHRLSKDDSRQKEVTKNCKQTADIFPKEDKKCPLCDKSFGQDEDRLVEHAASCNGLEELTQESCPICGRNYPPEQLPLHAQECAQHTYD